MCCAPWGIPEFAFSQKGPLENGTCATSAAITPRHTRELQGKRIIVVDDVKLCPIKFDLNQFAARGFLSGLTAGKTQIDAIEAADETRRSKRSPFHVLKRRALGDAARLLRVAARQPTMIVKNRS